MPMPSAVLKAEEVDEWLQDLIDRVTCRDCAEVPGRLCCKWVDQEYREEVVKVYRRGLRVKAA